MSAFHALPASRIGEIAVFVAAVVFTVVSLARFGSWLERDPRIARVRIAALLLVAVFYCMAAAGIADYAITRGQLNFLNLSFFLCGTAGTAILTVLMLRRGRDRELRRIAAHDL
ncbi:MAG TPA: hypothetical protein VMD53_15530 [Rhizomicrobium sp.]|nr:hypothetical protein [Rhizomicrobium sp.]